MLYINRLFLFLSFCIIALSSHTALALSGPVWKVSQGQNTLYLGGTIHLLAPSDYPLPTVFDQAYQSADVLVFEVDTGAMKTQDFQRLMLQRSTYRNGESLETTLAPATYKALKDFLHAQGGDVTTVQQFKPGMLSILLTLDALQRLGQAGQGVDEYFDHKAQADKKQRLFLETLEQQLSFLADMGQGREDSLILHTLDEIQELPDMIAKLKAAWRTGDNRALADVALTPWKSAFPEIYQTLLVERNQQWLPRLESMLTTAETEYVLVGALHLVGSDGVLEMLKAKGYQIEKLNR